MYSPLYGVSFSDVSKAITKLLGIIGVLVITYLIINGIVTADYGFLKGEITEYPVFCQSNCATKNSLDSTTYKVLVDQQKVLYWTNRDATVYHYDNCSVLNRTNWSCTVPFGKVGFKNGKYFPAVPLNSIYYTKKQDWKDNYKPNNDPTFNW